jgi:hypothetical protein
MAEEQIHLNEDQRTLMARMVAYKGSHRVERFDWASASVAEDLVSLRDDLAPYADLIDELQGGGAVTGLELLRAIAIDTHEGYGQSLREELETLAKISRGDFSEWGPNANQAEIEEQTRRLIDDDQATVAIAAEVLAQLDEVVPVAG